MAVAATRAARSMRRPARARLGVAPAWLVMGRADTVQKKVKVKKSQPFGSPSCRIARVQDVVS
jgi:hypothetical protein